MKKITALALVMFMITTLLNTSLLSVTVRADETPVNFVAIESSRTQRTTSLSLNTWISGSSYWTQEDETSIYTYNDSSSDAQGWKWQYDRSTSEYTLTLDSVDFLVENNSAITFNGTRADQGPNIRVILLGENKVVSTNQGGGNYDSSGIYFKIFGYTVKPTYTFEGSGSLQVSGYRNGIAIDTKGNLVIKDTTIVADSSTQSTIYTSSGNVKIENSNITASAGGGLNAPVVGVATDGDLTVTHSEVFVSLKDGTTSKFALCGENVSITNNSTITINGGNSTYATQGIYYKSNMGGMNISDSVVKISGVGTAIGSTLGNTSKSPSFTNCNVTMTSTLMSFPSSSTEPVATNSNIWAHSPEAIHVYGTQTIPENILCISKYVHIKPNAVLTVAQGQTLAISEYLYNSGEIINSGTIINTVPITNGISSDGDIIVAKYGGDVTAGTLDLKTNTPTHTSNTAYTAGSGRIIWTPTSVKGITQGNLTLINANMDKTGAGLSLPEYPVTIQLNGNNNISKIIGDATKVTAQDSGSLDVSEIKVSSYEQTSGTVSVVGSMTIATQNANSNSKLFTINGGSLTVTGTTGSFSIETDLDFVSSMINTSGMNVVTDPVGGKLLSRTADGKTIVNYATGSTLEDDSSNACTKVSFTKSPPISGGVYYPPIETEKVPQITVGTDGSITATDKDGKPIKEDFLTINGKTYYFGKDGKNVTGKYEIKGELYYFKKDGTREKSKFVVITEAVVDEDGKAVGDKTIQNTYYADRNGKILTGIRTIKKSKYYFAENGIMAKSQFVSLSKEVNGKKIEKTYYVDKNGKALTGLRSIKKSKYFFDANGVMVKSSFASMMNKVNGKQVRQTFYFDKNGKSLTGKRTISGKTYTFDKNGVLVK